MGFISQLNLSNFRNYPGLKLSLQPGITLLKASNGQGKTSLLESLGFLSLLRSIRGAHIRHLKKWQSDHFRIAACVQRDKAPQLDLSIYYGENRKLSIDSCAINAASEFIGHVNSIAFMPEDIEIVKGSASTRRQYLDILLSQLSPSYLQALKHYQKVLKSRNQLMKRFRNDDIGTQLDSWDDLLIQHGSEVLRQRLELMPQLREAVDHFTEEMFPPDSAIKVDYQANLFKREPESIEEQFKIRLEESRARDLQYATTHVGPHRDDLSLALNNRALASYGSEGQCRLSSLILKAAAAELLINSDKPDCVILLIDDVLGELDERSRRAFLQTISRGDQVFIACTEIPPGLEDYDTTLIEIENGVILSES